MNLMRHSSSSSLEKHKLWIQKGKEIWQITKSSFLFAATKDYLVIS